MRARPRMVPHAVDDAVRMHLQAAAPGSARHAASAVRRPRRSAASTSQRAPPSPPPQPAWRAPLPVAGAPHARVVALSYVIELDALFVAVTTGELLLLHAADSSAASRGFEFEEVGVVAGGVAAAAWSPDGEVVAVAGAEGKLLLLSKVRRRRAAAGAGRGRARGAGGRR